MLGFYITIQVCPYRLYKNFMPQLTMSYHRIIANVTLRTDYVRGVFVLSAATLAGFWKRTKEMAENMEDTLRESN